MILHFLGLYYPDPEAPCPPKCTWRFAAPLAPPTPHDHLYLSLHMCPSIDMSICHHATSLSVFPSICNVTSTSINISVITSTCPSLSPPVCPVLSPSDHPSTSNHLYAILPSQSDCAEISDRPPTIFTSLSDHPSLPKHLYNKFTSASACLPPSNHLTDTTTHLTTHLSSHMTQHMHDSSQSIAVVNGQQSHKAKNFHRAFNNYVLFLCALNVPSIYTSVSRHVAPHKSEDDAHVT